MQVGKVRWTGLAVLFFFFALGMAGIFSCTSGSKTPERYTTSLSLAAPSSSVSLADPDNFTFAIVGDLHIGSGNTARFRRILDAANNEGDAFIFLLGDIIDKGVRTDFEAYQQTISDAGFDGRVFAAIGNHDIFDDGWTNYREFIGPSHYTITLGNSKFIVLDTADATLGREQYHQLIGILSEPRPTNLFFISHYLPVIPGQRTYLKIADQEEAIRLMSVASENNVTGWFGGHYHSYIVDKIGGVDYVVAGGGGGRRMKPVKSFFFVQVTVAGSNISYALREVE